MSVTVFNLCILIGWALFSGGCIWSLGGLGVAASGLSLIILTFLSARIAGGLIDASQAEEN